MRLPKPSLRDAMPTGPEGPKRPPTSIGRAVPVMRIATSEEVQRTTLSRFASRRRSKNPMKSATLPRMRVGPAGQRLLDLLHRPMRGHEIAGHLDVSPQRVRQLVVELMAIGRVRVGDPSRVTLIVARSEDRSVLLSYPEERILSSLPQTEETTASSVAGAVEVTRADVMKVLTLLGDKGLVRETGQSGRGVHYALTEAGAAHVQYRSEARKARPVPLAVRSDRVRQVLSHLAERGPARIRDLRDALAIPHDSANALMQYLKRIGLIRKTGDALTAPLDLTTQGLETQQAMVRRSFRDDSGDAARPTTGASSEPLK